jgi:hypothetical protein
MMNRSFKVASVFLFIISPEFIFTCKSAGMGMGMGGNPCGGVFPPCPVPLDSGIVLLLIAGAIYGVKKIYDSTKKNPI